MPDKRRIDPPPSGVADLQSFKWTKWFSEVAVALGVSPFKVQAYSVADLSTDNLDPARWGATAPSKNAFSSLVYVYDETDGPTIAFSDGTSWRRVQDRAIVS